ncbi:MAG: UDP-N-acetylmuramoyl-L-alanine--D-glutamate ligase [Erysipelotrichales bacterium]
MSNKVLLIGLQKSGYAALALLEKEGYDITITVNNELSDDEKTSLSKYRVFDGEHPLHLLDEEWAFIVKNPGIPYRIPFIKEAMKRNIKIITEVELAYNCSENTILGITGTNGKTTVTTLIYDIVKEYYSNTYLAGNIGYPYSDVVLEHDKDNYIIFELSSFQLMGTENFRPHIATILNLAPDHLDYMESLESYYESKLLIYKNQTEKDYFILNLDDSVVNEYVSDLKAQVITFSLKQDADVMLRNNSILFMDEKIIELSDIKLVGDHNISNIMVAIAYSKLIGVSNEVIRKVIMEFNGVEYRLQQVPSKFNNTYFNDSKSTSADSTLTAIKALSKLDDVILIMGGHDKGLDYTDLFKEIDGMDNIECLMFFGANKEILSKYSDKIHLVFDNLYDVMDYINSTYQDKNILFSPGTSSYDQYQSYEKRGEDFNKLIKG